MGVGLKEEGRGQGGGVHQGFRELRGASTVAVEVRGEGKGARGCLPQWNGPKGISAGGGGRAWEGTQGRATGQGLHPRARYSAEHSGGDPGGMSASCPTWVWVGP